MTDASYKRKTSSSKDKPYGHPNAHQPWLVETDAVQCEEVVIKDSGVVPPPFEPPPHYEKVQQPNQLPDSVNLLEKLGEGGMANVYRVFEKNIDAEVALKVLKKEFAGDQAALKRFKREIDTASQLTHANIGQVFGSIEHSEPCIIMEYIDGITLSDLLKFGGRLDQQRLLDICLQLCDGLEYAHSRGVVHRDLKPNNIIVKEATHGDMIKIVDFGIARVMPSVKSVTQLTQSAEIFGTPSYMSPQQAQGMPVDHRTDLYALGCILYECLAGKPLFVGDNAIHVLMQHINTPVEPFLKRLPAKGVSDALISVIRKLLAKDPDKNYSSAAELSRDLRAVKNGNLPKSYINEKVNAKTIGYGLLGLLVTCSAVALLEASPLQVEWNLSSIKFVWDKPITNPAIIEVGRLGYQISNGDETVTQTAARELAFFLNGRFEDNANPNSDILSGAAITRRHYASQYMTPNLAANLFEAYDRPSSNATTRQYLLACISAIPNSMLSDGKREQYLLNNLKSTDDTTRYIALQGLCSSASHLQGIELRMLLAGFNKIANHDINPTARTIAARALTYVSTYKVAPFSTGE